MSESHLLSIDFAKASVFSVGVLVLAMCFLNENIEEELITNGEYDFAQVRKLTGMVCEDY